MTARVPRKPQISFTHELAVFTRSRTQVLATLAVFLLVPLFLFLGYWQLQRAAQKGTLQAQYDARSHETPINLDTRVPPAEELRFYRVVASGHYERAFQVLLDNRVQRGIAGYHVISPLRIQGSDVRVLVNRGWIPVGADRRRLPDIEPPEGLMKVSGVATVPHDEAFTLGRPEPLQATRPTVWPHLEMGRYAQSVPFAVHPVVILLDANRPGGFVREWNRLNTGIAVHQGYAFQWFALAVAVIVIYVLLMRRAARSHALSEQQVERRKR